MQHFIAMHFSATVSKFAFVCVIRVHGNMLFAGGESWSPCDEIFLQCGLIYHADIMLFI